MASEDVIELGSSDEESEPAPKKTLSGKHRPNAMVQFPPGLTIKSTKSINHNINPIKKLIGKGLTVTKVHGANQNSSNVRNGRPVRTSQVQHMNLLVPGVIPVQRPAIPVRSTAFVNPLNMLKKTNSPLKVTNSKPINFPVRVQNVKSLNKQLPSGITLTKKATSEIKITGIKPTGVGKLSGTMTSGTKRPAATGLTNAKKKQKVAIKQQVLTVNLDDEEVPTTSTASPQWYLRPEDTIVPDVIEKEKQSGEEPSMEKQNNSEPIKFVEITIEDSPLKPGHNKRTHEVGAELAITIDDSPVKAVPAKATTSAESDHETLKETPKDKQSKKKLEYPKDVESPENVNTTIEIELEPFNPETGSGNNDSPSNVDTNKKSDEDVIINEEELTKQNKKQVVNDAVIEVFESPAKIVQTPPSTPKKATTQKPNVKPITISSETSQPSEFHPVYQEFIDLCLKLENSIDMKTIVEKKIKNYYRQVPKEYTESEEFVELVQSKLLAMKAGPEKLYLYIKDIVDELNLQRKMAKAKPAIKETISLEAEKFQYGEESEFDSKRQRQIRKLEKTLKKLHRAIQKLEEQEVDFDDEEDSVYLLTESDDSSSSIKDLERTRSVLLKRYKERMVRVHAKFCQLTNTKMPSEPRIQIQQRPGQPAGPAKRLEKWVNKKVPIGKPLPFPDFHDVIRCVRDANDEDKLGWNEAEIMEEARDLFTRCGKKLQRRRQENEWRLAASRISLETDPAETSDDLKRKLDSNKQVAAKKETEVFNKYADKQSQLKLEAVEIGDKEAEESPVESEEEEPQEESSTLGNKEKRKERLRRLISEKSKKTETKEKESKDASSSEEKAVNEDDTKKYSKDDAMEIDLLPDETNKNSMEVDPASQSTDEQNRISKERIHSISDDNKVDSDVDELHLLQKLHSDEVNTSTVGTSDSDSPIDISDTLTSSDNKKPNNSDVISIENSSYSETEVKDDVTADDVCINLDTNQISTEKDVVEKTENVKNCPQKESEDMDCSVETIQNNKTNNQEYNESVESILLATTDEEADEIEKDESPRSNDECVNLKDDAISIGETVIEEADKNNIELLTRHDIISSPQRDSNKISKENSLSSYKNSEKSKETKATSVKTVAEEKHDLASEVVRNVAKNNITDDREVIEEVHSVESVESDNVVQETNKQNKAMKSLADKQQSKQKNNHCVESANENEVRNKENEHKSQMKQKLTVETIESDNFEDNVKGNENVTTEKAIDNPSVETLELDNSLETIKRREDINNDNPSVETLGSENSQETLKLTEMENPSVETLESDNSQETLKLTDIPSVETLESENSHEAAKETTPTAFEPKRDNNRNSSNQSKRGVPLVETSESDNSQEISKGSGNTITTEGQQSAAMENPSVETLESDKSQEFAVKETVESALNNAQRTENTTAEKESLIHELTDSNSPDQAGNTASEVKDTDLNDVSSDEPNTGNNLSTMIENLATATTVHE